VRTSTDATVGVGGLLAAGDEAAQSSTPAIRESTSEVTGGMV